MCKKTRDSWELLNIEDNVSNYEKYMLKEDKNGRVIISQDNVLRANAMIQSNSSYRRSADSSACPILKRNKTIEDKMCNGDYTDEITEDDKKIFKYLGSSAYWFSLLKEFYKTPKKKTVIIKPRNASEHKYEVSFGYVLYKTICCVDNENSTHLNADGVGRALIAYRLYNIGIDDLVEKLKKPQYAIIEELSKEITDDDENLCKDKSYYHVSFASKWCHNACYYMLDDKYGDNFAKVDSVMREALLKYQEDALLKYPSLNFDILKDNRKIGKSYGKYIDIIDAVRGSGKDEISRNGLDHLLWYSNKGFDNDDN